MPPAKPKPPVKLPAARQRLVPTSVDGPSLKIHLTLTRRKTLCDLKIPARYYIRDTESDQRWFNDEGCRTCAKVARTLERGCTRCPAILFKPEQVSRGLCAACYRKKRVAKPRPSQLAAQKEREKAAKAAEKAARAPLTTWPAAQPRIETPYRPMVFFPTSLDAILAFQADMDRLDHLLMAPRPVPEDVTIGRDYTEDGVRYTFHCPEMGLIGEVHLLLNRWVGGLKLEALASGSTHDPMTQERYNRMEPWVQVLVERWQQAEAVLSQPQRERMGPLITRPAYRDPERLRIRHYHCPRCDQVVADLVLADGTLADAIRMTLRTPPTIPTWIVVLQATLGEDAEAMAPVVPLVPVRGAAERMTAPAFERRIRTLRTSHCPPVVKAAKKG